MHAPRWGAAASVVMTCETTKSEERRSTLLFRSVWRETRGTCFGGLWDNFIDEISCVCGMWGRSLGGQPRPRPPRVCMLSRHHHPRPLLLGALVSMARIERAEAVIYPKGRAPDVAPNNIH